VHEDGAVAGNLAHGELHAQLEAAPRARACIIQWSDIEWGVQDRCSPNGCAIRGVRRARSCVGLARPSRWRRSDLDVDAQVAPLASRRRSADASRGRMGVAHEVEERHVPVATRRPSARRSMTPPCPGVLRRRDVLAPDRGDDRWRVAAGDRPLWTPAPCVMRLRCRTEASVVLRGIDRTPRGVRNSEGSGASEAVPAPRQPARSPAAGR
jgi:hypothetical protein